MQFFVILYLQTVNLLLRLAKGQSQHIVVEFSFVLQLC